MPASGVAQAEMMPTILLGGPRAHIAFQAAEAHRKSICLRREAEMKSLLLESARHARFHVRAFSYFLTSPWRRFLAHIYAAPPRWFPQQARVSISARPRECGAGHTAVFSREDFSLSIRQQPPQRQESRTLMQISNTSSSHMSRQGPMPRPCMRT